MTSAEFWAEYAASVNLSEDEYFSGELGFEARGFAGNERIASVLSGQKTGYFASLATYTIDNEPLPATGEYYVVMDNNSQPVCIVQSDEVEIVPFNQVPWAMAMLEGEDENLEQWRAKEREYLEEEADIVGFEFTEDLKLVFMRFHLVYK